jgi:hypothetical protein
MNLPKLCRVVFSGEQAQAAKLHRQRALID